MLFERRAKRSFFPTRSLALRTALDCAKRLNSRAARFFGTESDPLWVFGRLGLAFTIAPHLQTINYRGRFSRFVGI